MSGGDEMYDYAARVYGVEFLSRTSMPTFASGSPHQIHISSCLGCWRGLLFSAFYSLCPWFWGSSLGSWNFQVGFAIFNGALFLSLYMLERHTVVSNIPFYTVNRAIDIASMAITLLLWYIFETFGDAGCKDVS